jgi:hypothetical protein
VEVGLGVGVTGTTVAIGTELDVGSGVGIPVGSAVAVGMGVEVDAGTLPTLPEKTCVLSACFTASANTLSSDTSAVALDVAKSTAVGRVSQAPPW